MSRTKARSLDQLPNGDSVRFASLKLMSSKPTGFSCIHTPASSLHHSRVSLGAPRAGVPDNSLNVVDVRAQLIAHETAECRKSFTLSPGSPARSAAGKKTCA
jgi:hypothetical protein